MLLPFAVGIFIGLVLGLTGSGGSIFAVPLLVLVMGLPIHDAAGLALWGVALSAGFGLIQHGRQKTVIWMPAILLGLTGAIFAPVGRWLGALVSAETLTQLFTFLAVLIAWRMWVSAIKMPDETKFLRSSAVAQQAMPEPVCRMSQSGQFEFKFPCMASLVFSGAVLGILTGMFGVGGGFLIVPLLVFMNQVAMQQAIGTSLAVIFAVSSAGFLSYIQLSAHWHSSLLAPIALGGIAGMTIGQLLSARVAGAKLQKVFSLSLLIVALVVLFKRH